MLVHAYLHFLPFLTVSLEVEDFEVKVEDFKEVKVEEFEAVKVEGTELECWCQCCALGKLLPLQPPFSSSLTRPGLPGEILHILQS